MTRGSFCTTLTLALFIVPFLPAVSWSTMKPSGYIRSFAMYSAEQTTDTESFIIENRLRLKLSGNHTETLHSELAYELVPLWRDKATSSSTTRTYQGFSYRVGDLESTLYPDEPGPSETFEIMQNFDRAFLSYSADNFDLHFGRQPVAFGSARTVNPTDVLAPYPFNTIAKEERIGVDAIRLKVPLGQMSELDLGTIFGDDFHDEESAAYIRLKGYSLATDISIISMRFRENVLFGIDLARALGGAGTWLEAAYVSTNTPGDDYSSLATGAEYLLTEDLYVYLEYHRNGAGTRDRRNYIANALSAAYTDGGVYLLARDYLALGTSYQLTPLVGISMTVIYNMDDHSALIAPSLEYNVEEDIYIGMGGFAGTGDSSHLTGESSEFATYPDLWYASLSYYY